MTDHGETAANQAHGTPHEAHSTPHEALGALSETLGARLYSAGYTEPRLRQFWGGAVSDALVRNNAAPAIHHCRKVFASGQTLATGEPAAAADLAAGADLAAIALLFHFHQDVAAEVVRRALGDEAFAAAVDAGLIELGEDSSGDAGAVVTAPCALTPYDLPVGVPRGFRPGDENLYLISDHGTLVDPDVLEGDFVLGLGGAGRTLVSLTPRDRVGLAADIGTGCGIQALLLARHADRVIATDVSTRALRLAELSARLNGVDTIEFRSGSLLEPLSERVDLLVSNPPFVITPRIASDQPNGPAVPDFEYRDGGMTGDALVRSLFTAIPEVLAPGGRSVCLGNWELSDEDAAASAGPETWVADPDTSVLVIEREVLDLIAYAETWIRDGGVTRASLQWNQATAAWIDDFASRDVTGIVFGYVLMQRVEGQGIDNDFRTFADSATCSSPVMPSTDATFKAKVRTTSAPANNAHGIGAFVQTIFELRSWLQGV
ncbi:class I SAM-dependent methyltransferase, partial [Brevibacterium sp.]|uniref:class I SAM-dependent methyltransferase n=1 Tax=Brevibacterium sp. TaxID=1701 RepID=UPI002810FF65